MRKWLSEVTTVQWFNFGVLPLLGVLMLLNASLLGWQATDSARQLWNFIAAICTGAGISSVVYSWMFGRAMRDVNKEYSEHIRDAVKTTLVQLQQMGAVHPDLDLSRFP